MKIVVLAKYVPDAAGERTFAPTAQWIGPRATDLLSELDEYAVEQALQIADDGDDVEVVVMTLGPMMQPTPSSARCRWARRPASTSSTTPCTAPMRWDRVRSGRADQ
jgi:hypothetical protein